MVFQGSNTTDDGLVEYMRYRKADEDLQMSKPIVMNRSRSYFNKAGGKEVYIYIGELADTSSEKVKHDIKDAEYDFTTIVKNIKTKNI